MKKNYLLVLFALLTFALNINAQESTDQEETYNMTVTLPDGTSLIVNTNDVDEVTFSEGKLSVSGTSINEIVQKIRQVLEEIGANKMSIDEAKAYIQDLVKKVDALQAVVDVLDRYIHENRVYAYEALDRTTMNAEAIEALKERLEALESALQSASSCMCDPQKAAEALTMAEQALKNSEDAMHLANQNTDDILVLKDRTANNEYHIMTLEDVAERTKMELNDAFAEMRVKADILGDSIASVLSEVSKAESLAQVALQVAYNIEERAYTLASTLEARVAALEQENAMLIDTVNAQQTMINNLTTTVAAQDAKIATQNADIASLMQALVELGERVEALENK